jgi:hypothetical protein
MVFRELQYRYSEGIISSIKSTWGGVLTTTVERGCEGTLMAEDILAVFPSQIRYVLACERCLPARRDSETSARTNLLIITNRELLCVSLNPSGASA